ncbi:MAG: sulfurtransferase [Proteobacteria bacterium]|nr:sulfurtransferase [Pseudomonadota bacterium]
MDISVLLEPTDLAQLRTQQPVVIIDTRDPDEYAAEHIPGAVNRRDIFTYLIEDSSPDTMGDLQRKFADDLGSAGLSGDEVAVIYEDTLDNGYGQSCRGYFLLKYMGYPRVAILHGGYQAWKSAGLPVTAEIPSPVPRSFPVRIDATLMVGRDEMLAALDDPAIVKLDVRDYDEWVGDSSSPYGADYCPRKGRIPGAVWIEWYRMMEPDSDLPRFRPNSEILAVCDEVGIKPAMTVYIYCFKGSRASNTLIALKQAGFRDVRNYFSSWNEWSRDDSLPIESGAPDPARMARRR